MPPLLPQRSQALGLDFGTSNSTAGCWRPGQSTLLALEAQYTTIPSVVFFNADTGETCFGRRALEDYLAGYEGRLMRALKSLLGSRLLEEQTEVNGTALPFRDLLRLFIGHVRQQAQTSAGLEFDQVVLGRPVQFVDDDTRADRLAQDTLEQLARDCGFRQISFQFEPIAAAFHYEQQIDAEQLVLVVDIGGGTSDFSLVRLGPQRAQQYDRSADLLATAGVHIGGTDFDKYLSLAGVMPLFGLGSRLRNNAEMPSTVYFNFATWHTINFNYTRRVQRDIDDLMHDVRERQPLTRLQRLIDERAGHWLAMQVEQAKICLSEQEEYALDLTRVEAQLMARLTRTLFEQAIDGVLQQVERCVGQVLQQAGVAPASIQCIYFTGGSSAVPALRQRIARLLPAARAVEGDNFGSIGSGLALEAARRYGG